MRERVVCLTAALLIGVIASGPGQAQQITNMIWKENYDE
jgi:hypothetical protein